MLCSSWDIEAAVAEHCGPEAQVVKVYQAFEGDLRVIVWVPPEGRQARFSLSMKEGKLRLKEMP